MTTKPTLAIIGGSGLYDMEGLENTEQVNAKTPFGDPSAPITLGDLEGQRVAFLARHGIGHRLNPSEVNYRANVYALKSLGVTRVIGVSACGSLREAYAPGHIVIPDQLFDFTKDRERTFFSGGMVAHIDTAEPFCAETSQQAYDAVAKTGATVHQGGTFITIEGPRFSTKAESHLFRQWGMDIIGMTTSPEAYLAREAELCYAVIGHVTDYDVWHVSEEPVTVEMVIKTLNRNTEIAQQAVRNLARDLKPERECACSDALATAFITNPDVIPAKARQRLSLLVDDYL